MLTTVVPLSSQPRLYPPTLPLFGRHGFGFPPFASMAMAAFLAAAADASSE